MLKLDTGGRLDMGRGSRPPEEVRFTIDSALERKEFEPLVPRENGWPVLATLIDLKALLLREDQATFSREEPTVRIPFAPVRTVLVERLGMQTRLTPLAFAAASFLAE